MFICNSRGKGAKKQNKKKKFGRACRRDGVGVLDITHHSLAKDTLHSPLKYKVQFDSTERNPSDYKILNIYPGGEEGKGMERGRNRNNSNDEKDGYCGSNIKFKTFFGLQKRILRQYLLYLTQQKEILIIFKILHKTRIE